MDEQELLRKILHNPETAHFSKLKYANRPTTSLEDKVSFLNGLFNTAVEAKYTNDWDAGILAQRCGTTGCRLGNFGSHCNDQRAGNITNILHYANRFCAGAGW